MSTIKKTIIAGSLGLGIILGAPIVPVELQWYGSYETVAFNTADGDLGIDEYAINGDGWYVRTVAKESGNFESTNDPKLIEGKVEVSIVCEKCAYYDEFIDNGIVKRVQTQKAEYEKLIFIKDQPQPKRIELKSIVDGVVANAAIAFDAAANSTFKSAVSSYTYSHTTAGSERLLYVAVGSRDATGGTVDVTNVTYNSIALTNIAEQTGQSSAGCSCISKNESWYLVAPTSGANTVSVTLSGTADNSVAGSISLTGVKQTYPLDAFNRRSSVAVTAVATTTLSSVADNAWFTSGRCQTTSTTHTAGADETERWDVGGSTFTCAGTTQGPQTPAAKTGMSGTFGNSNGYTIIAASFAPSTSNLTITDMIYKVGTTTWTAPTGVTSVQVACWGGGGGGDQDSANGGGGGGGGAYARSTISVTPGASYDVGVGRGGLSGTSPQMGGDSYFGDGTQLFAEGGFAASSVTGGTGGGTTVSIGNEAESSGGNGGNGLTTNDTSGGGGGAGGPDGNGANGNNSTSTLGGNGGTADNTLGGAGGANVSGGDGSLGEGHIKGGGGGAGGDTSNSGGDGGLWGGGGGGSDVDDGDDIANGVGAQGKCSITYTVSIATGASKIFIDGQTTIESGSVIIQ